MELKGAYTALATPFATDGSLDKPALRRLVRYQVDGGIAGLVACGTTGETPTLADHERLMLVDIVIDEVAGRCPVIVGAGGNDTVHVCHQARDMEARGASALLSVAPYYNRPSQRGLIEHFRAVADSTDLPVILYNVPGRTGCSIEPETVMELATHPRIVAMKEASGRIESFDRLLQDAPPGFAVLSGDDALTLPAMSLGASGVISVVSNLAPARVQRLTESMTGGDLADALEIHRALLPLVRACFLDTNPVPVKAGLSMLGFMDERVRLPLVTATDEVKAELATCLAKLGLEPARESRPTDRVTA